MRFINQTTNYSLGVAAKLASDLISDFDSELYRYLSLKPKFEWARGNKQSETCTPLIAGGRLLAGPTAVSIFTYRPFNPFTSAIAMTNGDGTIHFNIYKLKKLQVSDLVSTILHEYAHLCGFGHGSNFKTKYKCVRSLPYALSEERWV